MRCEIAAVLVVAPPLAEIRPVAAPAIGTVGLAVPSMFGTMLRALLARAPLAATRAIASELTPRAAMLPTLPDHWAINENADKAHPFKLATSPARNFLNSSFNQTPTSVGREGRPTALMHPTDMADLGLRDGDVARLVITEGARFPAIAEFYYREVVERGIAAMRAMIERAVGRGELSHAALARFPQLVVAPGLVAILWVGLFDRFAHLDVAGMMLAHIEILLGPGSEP